MKAEQNKTRQYKRWYDRQNKGRKARKQKTNNFTGSRPTVIFNHGHKPPWSADVLRPD